MNAPCVICGSRDKRFLFLGKDRLHALPGSFRIMRCRKCGCIMVDPQPGLKELGKYYPSEYHAYAHYDPGSRKEQFAIAMYKLFFKPGRIERLNMDNNLRIKPLFIILYCRGRW